MRRVAALSLLPALAHAHPGHGPSALVGLWHWVATPEHGLPLLAAVVGAAWLARRALRRAR
ncbi:MAG: hypothetical protein KC613_10220 [Myxococcales bacterium]|nr:hypothetical protein [Myxococcales bacterium]MCB9525183.1 hypothetical protein [Myxococcales bacterium]